MKYNLLMILLFSNPVLAQTSNVSFSHTVTTTASPERIWAIWTDVEGWAAWDKGLRSASLLDSFALGAKGKLVSDKGNKSAFRITALDPGRTYTFKTRIPLGWLVIQRELNVKDGMTLFTHHVAFTGPLKKTFGKRFGKRYKAMLPQVMEEIKRIAEHK